MRCEDWTEFLWFRMGPDSKLCIMISSLLENPVNHHPQVTKKINKLHLAFDDELS
jgi:hypothetical protein